METERRYSEKRKLQRKSKYKMGKQAEWSRRVEERCGKQVGLKVTGGEAIREAQQCCHHP